MGLKKEDCSSSAADIDRKEGISLKEELKKIQPKMSMEMLEEIAEDENDFFLLRCTKPGMAKKIEKLISFSDMTMPPREEF